MSSYEEDEAKDAIATLALASQPPAAAEYLRFRAFSRARFLITFIEDDDTRADLDDALSAAVNGEVPALVLELVAEVLEERRAWDRKREARALAESAA